MVRHIASDLAGEAAVVQIDTEKNPRLAQQFEITGIPALLLLRSGKVLERLSGARTREAVVALVRRHLTRH